MTTEDVNPDCAWSRNPCRRTSGKKCLSCSTFFAGSMPPHVPSCAHVDRCAACRDAVLAKHDLSTIHLVLCAACREAYLARSEEFMRSTEPGGEIYEKHAKIAQLVDEVVRLRAEGKIP